MSTEFQSTIEDQIKQILSENSNEIAIAQAIFELSKRFQHHTSSAFLNVYSKNFNESLSTKLKPKDISRILSSSIPFNVNLFLKIFQKNPQDLPVLLESFEKFSKSFPITHTDSSNYYIIPLFLSSLLYGTEAELQRTININPSFFSSSTFQNELPKIISTAIKEKNKEAVNILLKRYSHHFDSTIVNVMINNQYEDTNLIAQIVNSPNFSTKEKQNYTLLNGETINTTFSGFLAYNALINQNIYDWKLFNKYNSLKPFSLNEIVEVDNKTFTFADILQKINTSSNQENTLTMFKELYNSKPFDEINTMLFFRHYLTSNNHVEFIHACSDPFFKKVMNSPAFSSSLLNRSEIMQNLLDMENSPEYIKYLENNNIFLRPAISYLNDLSSSYPEDFKNLDLHSKYFFNNTHTELDHVLPIDIITNKELRTVVLNSLFTDIQKITKTPITSFTPTALKNLTDIGLVHKKVEVEKTRGLMFTKTNLKEKITYDWNNDLINQIIKNQKTQNKKTNTMIDVFEFLVGEDNKPLEVSLIEGIVDDKIKNIAKNILLMVHSYKELDMQKNTIIPSEEMYFLDNRVGIMLSRLVKTYDDYKHYDSSDALRVLEAQLLMLQNRTSKAVHTVMLDDKQRLEQSTRINENILNKPINPLTNM